MATNDGSEDRAWRLGPIISALAYAVLAIMPPFLVGALSVGIRQDVGFGPGALGAAIAVYFICSSSLSIVSGAIVERLGIRRGLIAGASFSAFSLLSVALAPAYWAVLLGMLVGGAANAITQPAVGSLLSRRTPSGRLGLAFGVKQASIPASTLLGGILVPTLAVAVGWRATLGMLALVSITAATRAFRSEGEPLGLVRRRARARSLPEFRPLAVLSLGGAFGSAAATSTGTFLVASAVTGGITESSAGVLMASGSALGLVTRVLLGHLVDIRPFWSRYGLIILLLASGVPGFALMAVGIPLTLVVGAMIVFVAGWSWVGLLHYAVVSQNPSVPALTTGIVQTGMSMGGGLGPLVFGVVVEYRGYGSAWTMAACLSAMAAVTMHAGRRYLGRTRRRIIAEHSSEVDDLEVDDALFPPTSQGVSTISRTTPNLQVTMIRVDEGATYTSVLPVGTCSLLNRGSHPVTVIAGGAESACPPGHLHPAPPFRRLTVTNPGPGPAVVAWIERRAEAG